jgi:hypothetical protein
VVWCGQWVGEGAEVWGLVVEGLKMGFSIVFDWVGLEWVSLSWIVGLGVFFMDSWFVVNCRYSNHTELRVIFNNASFNKVSNNEQ